MKPPRHRRGVRFLATTIVVLSLAGGVAYATIPDNGNVFTACMLKKVGTIRLIDPSLGNSSLMGHCTALETQIKFNEQGQDLAALQAQVTTLETRVTALETLLAGVTRTAGPTLRFSGMNLQVVNGSGFTNDHANGLGNVIIGYNASDGDTRTGSHNLVIGDLHSFTSTLGLVTGGNNTASGFGAFVSGTDNIASGDFSFVTGGGNTASGLGAFVSGGTNTASGGFSFVAGGGGNAVSGLGAFVSGNHNTASGGFSFVGGGAVNTASGDHSFVGGGQSNTAGPGSCANIFGTFFPNPCP